MLNAADVTIRFGDRTAVSNVSFSLRAGRIIALLGPNGAGKSTLMRSLNGSIPVSSGRVELDGRPLDSFSRRDIARRIAVVAQENETRFPVTVLQYVLAGRFANGSAFGWEAEGDISAAREALERCDLGGFAPRLMNELSGGERQRVVLARALATEARILLLDEPTANLDLEHQAMLFRLVRERCDGCGAASDVITHDANLAAAFADEIMLMREGERFALGPPDIVLTETNIREVFNVRALLDTDPASGKVRVTTVY